jgi:hypothetical protein
MNGCFDLIKKYPSIIFAFCADIDAFLLEFFHPGFCVITKIRIIGIEVVWIIIYHKYRFLWLFVSSYELILIKYSSLVHE